MKSTTKIHENLLLQDLPNEIWRDIPDYEGLYQVSNLGRIKSLERLAKHCSGGSRKIKLKHLKLYLDKYGYVSCRLSKKGLMKTFRVHQLMAMAFLGHVPNGHKTVVDHKNNVKTDNFVWNIQIITQRKNTSKDQKNRSSKYIGVSWHKPLKKYKDSIQVNGKNRHIGYFENEIDAFDAYRTELEKTII